MRKNTFVAAANTSLEFKLTLNSSTPFPNQQSVPRPRNATPTSSVVCLTVVSSTSDKFGVCTYMYKINLCDSFGSLLIQNNVKTA